MEIGQEKGGGCWSHIKEFFSSSEIEIIEERYKRFEPTNVAYCSFESRFARSGGLAAVTARILPYINELEGIDRAFLLTPFYPHIIGEERLVKTGIHFEVEFQRERVQVEIYRFIHQYEQPRSGRLEEYYLRAAGFFEATNRLNDPYLYHPDNRLNNDAILENALFFCKAVPQALKVLGIRENILFHLQEWQTTLIALTAKEALVDKTLISCGSVQTMHNPYDCSLSWEKLEQILSPPRLQRLRESRFFSRNNGFTAYQIGLQLIDAPLTTVSENFKEELISDIIHTGYFASHLQILFEELGIVGINNGLFEEFPPEFVEDETISFEEIKRVKMGMRKALLDILATYKPPERFGSLSYRSRSIRYLPAHIPIFVMSGRLDPVQKGYEILLQAIQRFAQDEIKLVLAPMPVRDSDLDCFRAIAAHCRGNLTVFPIRMKQGYRELQMGSSFGIMPSIYEPFGAAVEYMVNGTVTIARATGGLVDQIDSRCGLLFRENNSFYSLENIEHYTARVHSQSKRMENDWFRDMATALYQKLKEAVSLYRNRPDEYYRMILQGFRKARTFDWQASAQKYLQVYRKVNTE